MDSVNSSIIDLAVMVMFGIVGALIFAGEYRAIAAFMLVAIGVTVAGYVLHAVMGGNDLYGMALLSVVALVGIVVAIILGRE